MADTAHRLWENIGDGRPEPVWPGGVRDASGNHNGQPSAAVGAAGVAVTCGPALTLGLPARRCLPAAGTRAWVRSPRRGVKVRSARVARGGRAVRQGRGRAFRVRPGARTTVEVRGSDGRIYRASRSYPTCG